jgi:Cysteine-rich secretory protein family
MASVCLVNFERATRGLPPIYVDGRLNDAAQRHSEDMAARNFFSHSSPEGCDPTCRAVAANYPGLAGENIHAGLLTASNTVRGWMASAGHRANILTPDYWTMGVGLGFGSRAMWTHTFGQVPPAPGAVHGLEPQFQGDADPTGTAAYDARADVRSGPSPSPSRARGAFIRSLRATMNGRRVTVRGHARPTGARIVVTLRRRASSTTARRRIRSSGTFRIRVRAPRGRGTLRVTARVGTAKRTVRVRRHRETRRSSTRR